MPQVVDMSSAGATAPPSDGGDGCTEGQDAGEGSAAEDAQVRCRFRAGNAGTIVVETRKRKKEGGWTVWERTTQSPVEYAQNRFTKFMEEARQLTVDFRVGLELPWAIMGFLVYGEPAANGMWLHRCRGELEPPFNEHKPVGVCLQALREAILLAQGDSAALAACANVAQQV